MAMMGDNQIGDAKSEAIAKTTYTKLSAIV